MSYEEDYRKPYKASCACGRGFVSCYIITESNDWRQTRESGTPIQIHCDYCKQHYTYACLPIYGQFLIPKGTSLPKKIPELDKKYRPSREELFVKDHSLEEIYLMINDMVVHRFMKHLEYGPAIKYAEEWYSIYGRKDLKPIIEKLNRIVKEYDIILDGYQKKNTYIVEHESLEKQYIEKLEKICRESKSLVFEYDEEQDRADHVQAQKDREKYEKDHQYDDFEAHVVYHQSYRVDSTGRFWDSFLIKECVDPQYLVLDKPQYGSPQITIVKKYLCVCSVCGKERIVNSSEFDIEYDEDRGYYPLLVCDCHAVSSFEAKTMDILNKIGISYKREISFDGLTGDTGHPLRFDFAFCDEKGTINIDNKAIRLLLELQGPHHYKAGYYNEYGEFIEDCSPESKQKLNKQLSFDERKRSFCEKSGIPLEVIKYTKSSNYEQLKRQIFELLMHYGFIQKKDKLPFS